MNAKRTRRRTGVAAALTAAMVGIVLSGCAMSAPQSGTDEEQAVEMGDVSSAVSAAVPRVTGVTDAHTWMNGFKKGLELTLETDSDAPFTTEELDTVAKTIWAELPWEPNTFTLYAIGDGASAVDLRGAAEGLDDLTVRPAGQAGVALSSLSARYGDWSAPK